MAAALERLVAKTASNVEGFLHLPGAGLVPRHGQLIRRPFRQPLAVQQNKERQNPADQAHPAAKADCAQCRRTQRAAGDSSERGPFGR